MVSSPKGLGPEKDCAGWPAAHTKDVPDLSSERAPHKNKTVTLTQVIKICRKPQMGALFQDILAG
jgi:hypothetical protein